jgi:hypothetical protein
MRTFRLASIVIVLAGCWAAPTSQPIATGIVEPSAASPSTSVQPAATLTGSIFDAICVTDGEDPVSHLSEGTQVALSDGSHNVLALGRLEIEPDSTNRCNFIFTVEGVPGVPFYSLVVGDYPPLVYSLDELEGKRWHLKLALDVYGVFGSLGS